MHAQAQSSGHGHNYKYHFEAEAWQKRSLAWFYGSVAADLLIISRKFEAQSS